MSRRKKNTSAEEFLDDFNQDDDGFIDGEVDSSNAIASFSFNVSGETKKSSDRQLNSLLFNGATGTKINQDNNTPTFQKGLTPPIDGEQFTVKRCYQFRPSTLRKLNEIKARNPDFNIYLNTILDEAILHYYDSIFNNNQNSGNT